MDDILSKTSFVFLGGDSYPKDSFIEAALRQRLPGAFFGHSKLLRLFNDGAATNDLTTRLDMVRRLLARRKAGKVLLIGRSSGARVATLIAAEAGTGAHPALRAVACLAYPFRRPGGEVEPARFQHLAELRVPTVIFQGWRDAYGGASFVSDYRLSPAITPVVVEADHAMKLTDDAWDMVARGVVELAVASAGGGLEKADGRASARVAA